MNTIISIVIALLIAGFVLWLLRAVIALIPLEPMFKQIVDLLVLAVVIGIVLFYVIIPLLHMLAGVSLASLH